MAKRKPSPSKDEAPRTGRVRAAGDLVADVGGIAFKRFGFVQSGVVSRWAEIVGERYAKVSSPESIRFPTGRKSSGVLTLLVEGAHAPLMQHLTPLIVERVNRFFGYEAINRIVFRQGRAPQAAASDGTGAGMEVSSSGVVAKPGPLMEDIFFGGGCQCFDRRPALEEPLVPRNHGGDRRLLEHHLAQPHPVRIRRRFTRCRAPRQAAEVIHIMLEQAICGIGAHAAPMA